MTKHLQNKRGLSLVEVLIGSFLMGLSLLAVGTAIYSQVSALNQNREKTIATLAVQGEIENIRGKAFDDISSYTFDVERAPGLAYLHKPSGMTQRGAVDVSQPYGADLKKVSVTVTWASAAGKTLQSKLVTLTGRGGIDKQ